MHSCSLGTSRRLSWLASLFAAVLAVAVSVSASAQTGPTHYQRRLQGRPISRAPVISNSRVLSVWGGAFTAVAEGTAGIAFNPASAAHRPYYSVSHFDWDFEWDILVPGIFQGDDFDFWNSGVPVDDTFVAFAVGNPCTSRRTRLRCAHPWSKY